MASDYKGSDREKAARARYREANRENINAYKRIWKRKWKAENPEKSLQQQRDHRERHKDMVNARWRAWRAANAEHYRAYCVKRNIKRASKRTIRNTPDDVYKLIVQAVPKTLPKFMRDDIAASMLLAMLEGQLLIGNVAKEVKQFLTDYNREYDTFKTKSLDAPISGTENKTLLDTLTYEAYEDDELEDMEF